MNEQLSHNHLSIGINKRFVEAIEWLASNKNIRISRREICNKIGLSDATYLKIKKGERSLPSEYIDSAALVLLEYNISADWLHNNAGPMLLNQNVVREDNLIIEILRKQLRVKEEYIDSLRQEIKDLRGSLGASKN